MKQSFSHGSGQKAGSWNQTIAFMDKKNILKKGRSLILIGTPHEIPKLLFAVQILLFHCLPFPVFQIMAFDKKNTFALAKTMKRIDFRHALSKIKCPVLIVCGAKEKANLTSAFCFVRLMSMQKMRS